MQVISNSCSVVVILILSERLKIGLAQNILYQFNIFCTGTKTNCTKVQIELQHIHTVHKRFIIHTLVNRTKLLVLPGKRAVASTNTHSQWAL